MTIELKGDIPSKKNSRRPFIRGRRVMNFPSANYVSWHKDASAQMLPYWTGLTHTLELCEVVITIYAGSNRKFDLTNKAESIMDLLVDTGFLKDDNWSVVPRVTLIFGGVDKDNPRACIELHAK